MAIRRPSRQRSDRRDLPSIHDVLALRKARPMTLEDVLVIGGFSLLLIALTAFENRRRWKRWNEEDRLRRLDESFRRAKKLDPWNDSQQR